MKSEDLKKMKNGALVKLLIQKARMSIIPGIQDREQFKIDANQLEMEILRRMEKVE